jgi:hypothetical protein
VNAALCEPVSVPLGSAAGLLAAAGWLGSALVVGAYLALTLRALAPGRPYQALNLLGSALVLAAAAGRGLYSVVALQAAWSAVSVAGLLREKLRVR